MESSLKKVGKKYSLATTRIKTRDKGNYSKKKVLARWTDGQDEFTCNSIVISEIHALYG